MFTNYLNIVGYNAEPVLLSYSDIENQIEPILYNKTKERPENEYMTTDKIKHEMWLFTEEEATAVIHAFEQLDSTYICDGHHRCASSAGLKDWREGKGFNHFPNEDNFLAFFLNERRLTILEFNRLVKTMNGLTTEQLISKLETSFIIEKLFIGEKPSREHEITMFVEESWYKLTCKESIIDHNHPVKCLDAEILTNFVLEPILGISDLKTNKNIDFISGNQELNSLSSTMEKVALKLDSFFILLKFQTLSE